MSGLPEKNKNDNYLNRLRRKSVSDKRSMKAGEDLLYIDAFNSDYLRILSSSSFRRLQDKTQLFPLEKNDFARTRLTHSCEVASTAKAIGDLVCYIFRKHKREYPESIKYNSLPIVAMLSSLLHDIGNPPFGHYGEDIIKDFFRDNWGRLTYKYGGVEKNLIDLFPEHSQEYWDFCGFDGNAQSLRVISKLELHAGNVSYGLNLTAAVMSGIIKYPVDSTKGYDPKNRKNKFGYFKSENDVIEFLSSVGSIAMGFVMPSPISSKRPMTFL